LAPLSSLSNQRAAAVAFTRPTVYAGVSLQILNFDLVIGRDPDAFSATTSLTMFGEFYYFSN
jgi:hypothetical protein